MMVNGMLAGLVAITAPCAFVQPWAAAVIGIIAGVIVIEAVLFIERKGIDDPVGAIAVHGVVRHLRRARASASSPTASTAPAGTAPTVERDARASSGSSTTAAAGASSCAQLHRRAS